MGSFNVALLQALLSIGVPPERAREVVELFERSIDERYSLHAQILATKRDLSELDARSAQRDADLAGRIAELDTRHATRIAELDTRLSTRTAELDTRLSTRIAEIDARSAQRDADLAARIAETKTDLLKWMLGALTAQTALLAGVVKLL